MNQLELIGKVATEYLKKQLQMDVKEDGIARFLLDRLTGEQVVSICKCIKDDENLLSYINIKVPGSLVLGHDLPLDMITNEKTTFWRNATCDKPAILLANTNDDQGQSLRDISRIGAGDLKSQPSLWVQAASQDLPIDDNQKKYWQQALKGLQEVVDCSLEQFSEYVVMVRELIKEEGVPVTRALGWGLPALHIPRDSYFFESIPANTLGHATRWKNMFQTAFQKRACYLYKQHPNRQVIENSEIQSTYEKIKSQLDPSIHPVIELYINSPSGWSLASEGLASLEWESDKVNLLFSEMRPMKVNLAEKTRMLYIDEFPETLTADELDYLDNLCALFDKRKVKEASDEDKEFYEKHRNELETDKSLKAEWDKFVYGKAIECTDFLIGLLECIERLFSQCDSASGEKKLKISTQKNASKKKWLELNEDVALLFCYNYRGIEKLTNWQVQWDTHHLYRYDELVAERIKKDQKKNVSTAKSAVQIVFYVELQYIDLQGILQKNDIKLIWHGNTSTIGLELHDDLKRLSQHPFSYSTVSSNPVNKKGKLQGLSLEDVGTLQAVFGQDRGSLVGVYSKTVDLQKIIKSNLKDALENGRLTKDNYQIIVDYWVNFSIAYSKAINDWIAEGISSESILYQCEKYDELLRVLSENALGDLNRINILQQILKIGNVKVEGNKPITIITPWHPMRITAKAIKARQVVGLLNHLLQSDHLEFGDSKLFFTDLKTELEHPYYPEVALGYKGNEPVLVSVTDTRNDYSLMEYPIRDEKEMETNEDPREASTKLLSLVERYLELQPHEKTNLSVVLFNCDSTRLPESIVNQLSTLHESEEEVRCQVILRHKDSNKLSDLYMKLVEETDNNADSFVASEVTRDFMARLRVGVMAHEAPLSSSKEGKVADIVFLQDVISRQANLIWDQVEVNNMPDLFNYYPPRWAKRRSNQKDELKSTVYLTCPSQTSLGWSYLSLLHSVIEEKDHAQGLFYLPARQISFQNENVKEIFDEAHKLGEWVVNYDELLERRQLKNLGVKVIKYQQNKSHGSNIIVSSSSKLNLLKVLIKRRLSALNLTLNEPELLKLTDRFIDEANSISGDIVLRAAKRGVFAGELIGVVLSKVLTQAELSSEIIGWYFLDDYASWLGQKEEQIADILALCPLISEDNPYLQVIVTEAKFIDSKGLTEAKKNSAKQLRDTINRLNNAIFGDPGRLDRDLWLSRLSDLFNDGIELPPGSPFSVDEWRDGIRNGNIPIEIKGYSHMFLSTVSETTGIDSERLPIPNSINGFQEVYTRDDVRELILNYFSGDFKSILTIRKNLDEIRPWENVNAELPASRIIYVIASEETNQTNTVTNNQSKSNDIYNMNVPDKTEQQKESNELEQNRNQEIVILKSSEEVWPNARLNEWILENAINTENDVVDESWVSETVNKLRMALISYNHQAKVIGHRLTPNSIVVRLKGSDQLRLEDIEKKRSLLLTTHALNVISLSAQPGEVVVSLARPNRQSISLADVWKMRKINNDESGLNMSFVIGVKEIDGELLYLNLGGEFEGLAQHAPHTLIAGATGSGKSVLLQNLILDICVTNPKELANIYLIDPKYGVDYQHLENLPHLVEGIIDEQQKAIEILENLVVEMDERYKKFKEVKVNNLRDFNSKVDLNEKLPLIFLIHDEFAEWMLVEEYKKAVSSIVQRLGVKARAAGIHLIFAAQRPDANVLPPQLRDNLGNRLILRVESTGTSVISLGEEGAEKLLGKGHLVARLQGEAGLIYAQVPFVSSEEIDGITTIVANNN